MAFEWKPESQEIALPECGGRSFPKRRIGAYKSWQELIMFEEAGGGQGDPRTLRKVVPVER